MNKIFKHSRRVNAVFKQCRSYSQQQASQPFNVLGIETSCDDTGVAIVSNKGTILSERLTTHYDIVKQYGGVFPNEVAQFHQQAIQQMISETIEEAGKKSNLSDIDAIAVTCGPGLNPCLKVGVQAAKQLARQLQKPIIAVNHLEAHILLPRMFSTGSPLQFPFLTLLVSGGHCLLIHVQDLGSYKVLASTTDDSIGEAIDKVARLLNIDYGDNEYTSPGAALEQKAKLYKQLSPETISKYNVQFTVPLRGRRKQDIEYSFSGLKSNVLRHVRFVEAQVETSADLNYQTNSFMSNNRNLHNTGSDLPEDQRICIAHSFQDVAFIHLLEKTEQALQKMDIQGLHLKDFVICGGVSANKELRLRLQALVNKYGMTLRVAPIQYCTDNGVMVAWTGIERFSHSPDLRNESIDSLDLRGRWPLETLSSTRNFVPEQK